MDDSAGAAASNDANNAGQCAVNYTSLPSTSELPFLVTHWLANYRESSSEQEAGDVERDAALERLRNATAEMAAAFSALGAYGTASQPSFADEPADDMALPPSTNATYGDLARRWQSVPSNRLDSVVQAAASVTTASENVANRASTNLLLAAQESQPATGDGGRRLADGPLVIPTAAPTVTSILETPALIGPSREPSRQIVAAVNKTDELPLAIESDAARLGDSASKAMRAYLTTREEHQKAEVEIQKLKREVTKQQVLKERLEKERAAILANGNEAAAEHAPRLSRIGEGLLNTDRLIPQHMNTLTKMEKAQRERTENLGKFKQQSQLHYSKLSGTMKHFRDPSQRQGAMSIPVRIPSLVPRTNSSFFDTITRQYSAGGNSGQALPRRMFGASPTDASAAATQKSILAKRLAYSMTASAHLAFPVFCLAFDKTGRYFVTGADDCLVKIFCIGPARSNATTGRTFSYGSNDRSAVLVCTLRGHAGVICDIDVSADNAFIATASDDGDCRVWGLKDGSPIAILRGHKDGANMVSWSQLVPYRLVTTGSDGVSRMWDIREAALNRYGAHVGKRSDYVVAESDDDLTALTGASPAVLATGDELLPPLPVRNGEPMLPPLPLPNGHVGQNGIGNQGNEDAAAGDTRNANEGVGGDNVQPGQFVRNDMLDEGVRLVTKLQHGAPPDTNLPGASTRSRRKAVKVICVARCPRGGHFATGAEDGICRVWSEEEGSDRIAKQDAKHSTDVVQPGERLERRSIRVVQQLSEGRLLAELTGHVNSITDLHYSNAGDRILTASQKDGVARVWSWTESLTDPSGRKFENVKQILLQVKKPQSMVSNGGPSRNRTSANNASCDVAVWTADDARIITSQCSLVKEGSPEIVENSQYLLVWDSRNGQCLLGIASAHNAQVPVLVPHPTIPTLLCSAGGDGIARLWDLEKGSCFHLHENKILDIGPVAETNEQQRKCSGYLDGSFSPDGLSLVLTDDSGRFTLFCISNDTREVSSRMRRSSSSDQRIPAWMKEQYFANDYYELYFDTNGYCVERGSEQPPHLAPRAARCSFTGSPWAEEVNDIFSRLVGPLPLSEDICRRNRGELRYNHFLSETACRTENNRANLVSYFDPFRTVLIDGQRNSIVSASELALQNESVRQSSSTTRQGNDRDGGVQRGRSQNARGLSSNYRWSGYEDILAEEAARELEEDADDDDYVAPAAQPPAADEYLSDEFMTSESEGDDGSPRVTRRSTRSSRNRRRRRGRESALLYEERSRTRPTRVSARQLNRAAPEHYEAQSDSDAFVEEFLSTNNTPSGPHVRDYTTLGHYFKLPDSGRVRRQWLLRTENRTSHNGVKNYAPQVGDSVVYVPRAHYETIKVFPLLDAPWKHFERGTRWPVVRCTIRDIRYRFPYEQYYRSGSQARCLSVVAILTLEVTGIPALSEDSIFPWPKPSFIDRQTRGRLFEVSMFESGCPEFIIPEVLFTWRLRSIENASGRTRHQNEVPVIAYFSNEDTSRISRPGREDVELQPYRAIVKKRLQNSESEPDEHLLSSGYGTLEVEWTDSDDPNNIMSPWEVSPQDMAYEVPSPPTLSEAASLAVAKALAKVEALPNVEEYFMYPVDETRYSDYRNRVEVPMNFSFIKERLAAGYYSNILSVLSDAKLVKENCLKYNGPSELSQSASDVYDVFQNEVKSHVDVDDSPVSASVSLLAIDVPMNQGSSNDSSRASRVARRQRQDTNTRTSRLAGSDDGGTSLERLPLPDQRPSTSRTTRRASDQAQNGGRGRRRSLRGQELDSSGSNESVLAVDKGSGSEDDYDNGDHNESSDNSSDSDDGVALRRSSRRSGTRTSRQRTTRKSVREEPGRSKAASVSSSDDWEGQHHSSEEDDDDDDEEKSESSPPSQSRRSIRISMPGARRQRPKRTSPRRSTRSSAYSPDEDTGASRRRRSTRSMAPNNDSPRRSTRAHQATSLADLSHSDVDEADAEMENTDSSDDEISNVKRRSSVGKRKRQSPPRSSPRRTSGRASRNARLSQSLADLSESDVDDGEDDSSSEEEMSRRPANRKSAPKRSRSKSSEPRAAKRARTDSDASPELEKWPEIDAKAITKVVKGVLRHLSDLDEENIFAKPVIESVPDLEETYLEIIESPMDFRTIEEDQMQYYGSIQELQDDLVLVFRNCATFNLPSSEYHAFAITMWQQLNDVFQNVCNELNVMLPRRWNK